MDFVGNLLIFPALKEFLKSVKNRQSYCHEFGVLLFLWHSVYWISSWHTLASNALLFNWSLTATSSTLTRLNGELGVC